jgi:hypothetical protein
LAHRDEGINQSGHFFGIRGLSTPVILRRVAEHALETVTGI